MKDYALDSDIASYILREEGNSLRRYNEAIARGDSIYIPPYVYYEIQRWISIRNARAKQRVFDRFYEKTRLFPITVAELDRAIDIYVSLKKRGITIGDADILIAAFCLEHDFTLVTNNTEHFKHIPGLSTVN